MNTIEFIPYHNKHIRFKNQKTGTSNSGVIFDIPWEEKDDVSTHYYFVPTENLVEYKNLEFSADNAEKTHFRKIIDIAEIDNVVFYNSLLSREDLQKLKPYMRENIDFFQERYEKEKKNNESFKDYLYNFEEITRKRFIQIQEDIIKPMVVFVNKIYDNKNTSQLGFAFSLKVNDALDSNPLDSGTDPFSLVLFEKDDWRYSETRLPFLYFEGKPEMGKIFVFVKPNVVSSGVIKIGDFSITESESSERIKGRIEECFSIFIQRVTARLSQYAY